MKLSEAMKRVWEDPFFPSIESFYHQSSDSIQLSPSQFTRMLSTGVSFPEEKTICVEGDVALYGFGLVLPANLKIEGNLQISQSNDLSTLPADLQIDGDLELRGCAGCLPDGFQVGENLFVYDCKGLILPPDLKIKGHLEFRGSTGLTALPVGLQVGGDLSLYDCECLTALPVDLQIGGLLNLIHCTSLTTLPEGFLIGGELVVAECVSLTALPAGLQVGGDLAVYDCDRLTALPVHLQIGGNLTLNGCTDLAELPFGLEVPGDLNLRGCTNLIALPADLKVGGDLNLSGCTSLTALPFEPIEVGGDLDLEGCTSLTALPTWMMQMGRTQLGQIRIIDLSRTGLSDEVIGRLRRTRSVDIEFYFSQRAQEPACHFSKLEDALAFWVHEAGGQETPVVEFSDPDNIRTFLTRLMETKE